MSRLVFSAVVLSAVTAFADPYQFVAFNIWGNYFGNPPEERAPQQVAVLGIDDFRFICENARPTLSSILPDFVASGRIAAGSARHQSSPSAMSCANERRWTTRWSSKTSTRSPHRPSSPESGRMRFSFRFGL